MAEPILFQIAIFPLELWTVTFALSVVCAMLGTYSGKFTYTLPLGTALAYFSIVMAPYVGYVDAQQVTYIYTQIGTIIPLPVFILFFTGAAFMFRIVTAIQKKGSENGKKKKEKEKIVVTAKEVATNV